MTFERLLHSLDSTRLTLELTSGRPLSGDITCIGDNFVAIRVHNEHNVSEIVPFTSIAAIHSIPTERLQR